MQMALTRLPFLEPLLLLVALVALVAPRFEVQNE
jgi:hypothetical protein